ncbi:hypothetical protein [uncultured Enterovirga sp.]|uniref:hypothetical protein n=1 Tax=uncultured Enterovirga sp. TaxID=2026352 RepID=UPI0035C96D61
MSVRHSLARITGTFASNFDLLPRERGDLVRHGVAATAIDTPTPVRAGHVVFGDDGRFSFEQHERSLSVRSARAFLFLIEDMHGEPSDIVAWQPALSRVASWRGTAWGIGQSEAYAMRMAEHDGLPVWRNPLDWLRAGRRGVVIMRPRLAAAWLNDAGPLVAEDFEHARELRTALTRPAPRILVPAALRRQAA